MRVLTVAILSVALMGCERSASSVRDAYAAGERGETRTYVGRCSLHRAHVRKTLDKLGFVIVEDTKTEVIARYDGKWYAYPAKGWLGLFFVPDRDGKSCRFETTVIRRSADDIRAFHGDARFFKEFDATYSPPEE